MPKLALITAVAFLTASAANAFAAQRSGASTDMSSQQQMNQQDTNMSSGASNYAPGHRMKQHRSVTKGASKYAPGNEMKRGGKQRY